MFCYNCGLKQELNAGFCANCGAAQVSMSEPSLALSEQPLPSLTPESSSAQPVPPSAPLLSPLPQDKEVKIWKSVVLIFGIIALLVGGLVALLILVINAVVNGVDEDYVLENNDYQEHAMEGIDYIETVPNEDYIEDYVYEETLVEENISEEAIEEETISEETIEEEITEDTPHIAAMQQFEDLVMEMYSNGGIVSKERVIELFGNDYTECDCMEFAKVFTVTSEFRVHFRNYRGVEGIFDQINIYRFPAFVTNKELILDEAVLRSYGERGEVFSLEYLERLVGESGILSGYRHTTFTYQWRTPVAVLRARVSNRGIVRSIVIEGRETFEARFDHLTPAIIRDVVEDFAILASEMDANNGLTTRVRVMELFGVDFVEIDIETSFFMSYEVSFDMWLIFSGNDEGVNWMLLSSNSRIFLDEDLEIDSARIREYQDNWDYISLQDRPHLSYFEDMIGTAGSLARYSYSLRLYVWESSDYDVEIWTNRDGVVTSLRVR